MRLNRILYLRHKVRWMTLYLRQAGGRADIILPDLKHKTQQASLPEAQGRTDNILPEGGRR